MLKGILVVVLFAALAGVVSATGMVSPWIDARWDVGEEQSVKFFLKGDNSNQTVEFFFDGKGILEVEGDKVYRKNVSLKGYEMKDFLLDIEAVKKGEETVRWGFTFIPGSGGLSLKQEIVDVKKVKVVGEAASTSTSTSTSGGGGGGSVIANASTTSSCNGSYVLEGTKWVCSNPVYSSDVPQSLPDVQIPIVPVMGDVGGESSLAEGVVDVPQVREVALSVEEVSEVGGVKGALQVIMVLGACAVMFQMMVMILVRDEL